MIDQTDLWWGCPLLPCKHRGRHVESVHDGLGASPGYVADCQLKEGAPVVTWQCFVCPMPLLNMLVSSDAMKNADSSVKGLVEEKLQAMANASAFMARQDAARELLLTPWGIAIRLPKDAPASNAPPDLRWS